MSKNSLKIIHYNVQSFRNKFLDYEVLLNETLADCLCLNEHWLVPGELDTIPIQNYSIVSGFCRSVKSRGGVSIYAKNNLVCVSLNLEGFSEEQHCEVSGILIKNYEVQLITIYRSPNGDFDKFLETLPNIFNKLNPSKSVVITGDFNVHFNERDARALNLCNLFRAFNLKKTVKFNTRLNRCLDNVFTNIDSLLTSSEPVDLTYQSDHIGILFKYNFISNNSSSRITYKPITDEGLFKLYNTLENQSFQFVVDNSINIEKKFEIFTEVICDAMESSFQQKTKTVNKNHQTKQRNWFNNNLKDMRERLKFLVSLNKINPTAMPKAVLSNYRKEYRDEIKAAKIKFNDDLIASSSSPQREMWNLIQNKKVNHASQTILHADNFNTFFCSIAENVINNLADAGMSHNEYLTNATTNDVPQFRFASVGFVEVRDAISTLKDSNSKDINEINTKIIKTIKNLIYIPLTKLINESMACNTFPSIFKVAKVVPLYKGKGSADDYTNYRPISILPILSKVYERVIKNQINEHFESNNLFATGQFGFRKNKTTSLAIDHLTSDILEGFEDFLDTHASFLDLTKAFDCVTHGILLEKLQFYGFRDDAVLLVNSYLSNRIQYVEFNKNCSSKLPLHFGVPQGSVLGPILFLVYINDLVHAQDLAKIVLFADDTSYYQSYHPIYVDDVGFERVGAGMLQWFLSNRLSLNNSKSQAMNFTLRNTTPDHPFLAECVEEVKFLGVHLDPGLTWESHVVHLSKKLAQCLFLLRNLVKITSQKTVLTAYHGYFHSKLSYAILSWGHSCHTDKIFGLQRKCVRIIGGLGFREDCRQCFIDLRILTTPCVYILQCLLHIKQNLNTYQTHLDLHNYPTRTNTNLVPDFSRLERARNGTRYLAIKFYNLLPTNIKVLGISQFKIKIKKYLMAKAFYSYEEYFISNFNNFNM